MQFYQEYDYIVRKGETFSECFWMEDSDRKPIDLTGKTAMAEVRKFAGSPEILATMATEIDIATGCVSYKLTAEETDTLPIGTLAYDVALYEDVSGVRDIHYYLGGKFKVVNPVTDALP